MRVFLVTVPQASRTSLRETIRTLGYPIEEEGYTDGSTSWTVSIVSGLSVDELTRSVLGAHSRLHGHMNCAVRLAPGEPSDPVG